MKGVLLLAKQTVVCEVGCEGTTWYKKPPVVSCLCSGVCAVLTECPKNCKMCANVDGSTKCFDQQCQDGYVLHPTSFLCVGEWIIYLT